MENAACILNQDDRIVVPLIVPYWKDADGNDLEVHIRTLKSHEIDAWERSLADKDLKATRLDNFRARYCVLILCDVDGKRIFTDQQAGALGEKSAAALSLIFDAGYKLNKQDDGAVESAEENSEAAQSGSSGSDSPSPSDAPSTNSSDE